MEALAFDSEFQRKLVKLALLDDSFCTIARSYIEPQMFESDGLRWCWQQITAERDAGRAPTLMVLRDKARKVDPQLQRRYSAMVEAIDSEVMREDAYIRHALAEFVQRNLFVQAYKDSQRVYNTGKHLEAIDGMQRAVEKIRAVSFDAPKRFWFYDDVEERQRSRVLRAERDWEFTFPSGIVGVDEVLDGGLSKGELGVWIADAKGGKSVFLVHLAAYTCRALQRRVLLILLEGSYDQTSSRLDAWHAKEMYAQVKRGDITAEVWQRMLHEYRQLRRLMVIREMTDNWNYNAADIRRELDDLKAQEGWRPDQLVVDYGDLLRSDTKVASEEEHQRNAFSALKSMTAQDGGYSIWTASQARRPQTAFKKKKQEEAKDEPERDVDDEETYVFGKPVLRAKDIADSYNKIRRADFIGSINQDEEDKTKEMVRLWCDRYRDNAAQRLVLIKQDLDRMTFVDLMDRTNRPDRPERVLRDLDRKRRKANEG